MVYRRGRRTGGSRRGRRLQQDGQIVARRARNAALVGAIARYGPGAVRGVYGAVREMVREKRMRAREEAVTTKRTRRTVTTSKAGVRRGVAQSSMRSKMGRKTAITYNKLLRLSVPKRVLRFSGIRRAEDEGGLAAAGACPGYYPMNSTIGDNAVTSAVLPMYVVQLNGTMMNSGSATVLRRATLHSTGRIEWVQQNGVGIESFNPTVLTNFWGVEYGQSGTEASTRTDYICNDWMDVRLNMYGAKENLTRYYIDLIQVADDWAAVEDESELATLTGTHAGRYQDAVYGFWQGMVRPCVANKIAGSIVANKYRYQPYRVLRSWKYTVKPESTTEENNTANFVSANLFIRDGRVINYAWQKPGNVFDAARVGVATGMDDIIAAPNYVHSDYLSTYNPLNNPHPRARRYLVIRCDAPVSQSSAATGDNFTPSFDLLVRKRERLSTANRP